jgi:hypothetical protein
MSCSKLGVLAAFGAGDERDVAQAATIAAATATLDPGTRIIDIPFVAADFVAGLHRGNRWGRHGRQKQPWNCDYLRGVLIEKDVSAHATPMHQTSTNVPASNANDFPSPASF